MRQFEDSIDIAAPVETVYQFIFSADIWPTFLSHVVSVDLQTTPDGNQLLTMQTRAGEHVITTRSIRRCTPCTEITFDQLIRPPWLSIHAGVWSFTPENNRTVMRVTHRIELDEAHIGTIAPHITSLEEAYIVTSQLLLQNSRRTMECVKQQTEQVVNR